MELVLDPSSNGEPLKSFKQTNDEVRHDPMCTLKKQTIVGPNE